MNKSKLLNYIGGKIKKWKLFPDIIRILYSCKNDFFDALHIKTFPQNDPIYKTLTHKPNYWTFSFLCFKEYPEDIFLLYSDHDDGVYKKLLDNNKYFINKDSYCIFGKNTMQGDAIGKCFFSYKGIMPYVNIDWTTGTIMNNDANVEMANNIIARKGLMSLPVLKLFKIIATTFQASSDLPKILNNLSDDVLKSILHCLVINDYSEQAYEDCVLLIPEEVLNKVMSDSKESRENIMILMKETIKTYVIKVNHRKKLLKKREAYKKKKIVIKIEDVKNDI
jgi:hypothetical protein